MLVFRKELMLARLKKEGREKEIDKDALEIMDRIDGLRVVRNDWQYMIFDRLEMMVNYNGEWFPVNISDCEIVE